VIYHYFASKDEVIHAVYLHVKSLKLQSMLEGQVPNSSFKQAYLHMYVNAYTFYRTHLRETRFLDLYENSTFCAQNPSTPAADLAPEIAAFMQAFRPKSEGGVLKNLPIAAIYEFAFGTARQLAKKEQVLDSLELKNVALASWAAISDD
jgi:AcrR family transcriptional regulator